MPSLASALTHVSDGDREAPTAFADLRTIPMSTAPSSALLDRGVLLAQSDRRDEAISEFSKLIEKFLDSTESPIREQVSRALLNKGYLFCDSESWDLAIMCNDELLKTF